MWGKFVKLLEWFGHGSTAVQIAGWIGLPTAGFTGFAVTFFSSAAEGWSPTSVWIASVATGALLALFYAALMIGLAYRRSKDGSDKGEASASLSFKADDLDLPRKTNKELMDYVINLASQMRTLEENTHMEVGRVQALPVIARPITAEDAAEYSKRWHDANRQGDEIYSKMKIVFGNTYLHPAIEVREEIESRLKRIGIFREPKYRLGAFEGNLAGPDPVSEAANYIEQIARELYNRGGQKN